MSGLRSFFEPDSVAVIGASKTPGKAGYAAVENLRLNGYAGRVYPVNPNGPYASVKDIPEIPEVAAIVVPAAASVKVLWECAKKGVPAAVVMSGGFAELGMDEGRALQKEIAEIAGTGIRVMGPNTSGLVSAPTGFLSSMYPLGRIRRGTVAYVGQTGNFGTHGLHWLLSNESYGVSRVVGLGNQVDVGFAEVFEYLAEDMETETVCVYIEGLGEEGDERFIEAARRLSRRKPVIALKGGATLAGARAVGLHTASRLTGWEAETVFAKTGIVRVERYQDLFEHTKALAFQPLPRGNRVAVIVPSGGMGVMAADACEREGLELATLSEETLGKLRALSQPWITVSDPIDYWSAVLGRGVEGAYGPGMEAVLEDPGVDALVSITIVLDGEPMPDFSFVRLLAVRHPDKPILMAISGDKKPFEEARRFLEERSVPVYLPVEGAIEALGTMYRCSRARMPAEVLGNLPAGKHG